MKYDVIQELEVKFKQNKKTKISKKRLMNKSKNWVKIWLTIFQLLSILSILIYLLIPFFAQYVKPIVRKDTINVVEESNTLQEKYEGEAVFNIESVNNFSFDYNINDLNLIFKDKNATTKLIPIFLKIDNNLCRLIIKGNGETLAGTYYFTISCSNNPYFYYSKEDSVTVEKEDMTFTLIETPDYLTALERGDSLDIEVKLGANFKPAEDEIQVNVYSDEACTKVVNNVYAWWFGPPYTHVVDVYEMDDNLSAGTYYVKAKSNKYVNMITNVCKITVEPHGCELILEPQSVPLYEGTAGNTLLEFTKYKLAPAKSDDLEFDVIDSEGRSALKNDGVSLSIHTNNGYLVFSTSKLTPKGDYKITAKSKNPDILISLSGNVKVTVSPAK